MNALPLTLWATPIIVTVIVARQKGYRLLIWIPLAVIFSVFALCLIALLPTQQELKARVSRIARAWQEDKSNLLE